MKNRNRYKNWILGLSALFLLAACEPNEEKVTPKDNGLDSSFTIDLNTNGKYSNIVFFNLQTKDSVHFQYSKWDLEFESGLNSYNVFLNSSAYYFLKKANSTNFSDTFSDKFSLFDPSWKFDAASGNRDSLAFGDWRGSPKVYILCINGGDVDNENSYYKIQMDSVDQNFYYFKYARRNESEGKAIKLAKNPLSEKTRFNFTSNLSLNREPGLDKYDLVFGRFTDLATQLGLTIPYQVVGVLSDNSNQLIAIDSIHAYSSINLDSISKLNFSSAKNAIGHSNWKKIDGDLEQGKYKVYSKYVYILKSRNNKTYKLRFLDFYDKNSSPGYIKIQYSELKN